MVSVAISAILGAGITGACIWQLKAYTNRMAELDARMQAQTIFALLADSAASCGFGFGHANDAAGAPAIGVCQLTGNYWPGWAYTATRSACAGVDNGGRNDRLRLAWIDINHPAWLAPAAPSAGPCGTDTSPPDPSRIHLTTDATWAHGSFPTYDSGTNLFIGGDCQDAPPSAATDAVSLSGSSRQPQGGCLDARPFACLTTNGGSALSCPTGYAPGFALGVGETREVYTDTDPISGLPRLMVGSQAFNQLPSVLAVGVTRFEVRYAFDTSSNRNHKLTSCPGCTDDPFGSTFGGPLSWCREVRAGDAGGSCMLTDENGVAIDTAGLRARVLAIHVTFDLVAPQQTAAFTKQLGLPIGAKTWTFHRLFALPNMAT